MKKVLTNKAGRNITFLSAFLSMIIGPSQPWS